MCLKLYLLLCQKPARSPQHLHPGQLENGYPQVVQPHRLLQPQCQWFHRAWTAKLAIPALASILASSGPPRMLTLPETGNSLENTAPPFPPTIYPFPFPHLFIINKRGECEFLMCRSCPCQVPFFQHCVTHVPLKSAQQAQLTLLSLFPLLALAPFFPLCFFPISLSVCLPFSCPHSHKTFHSFTLSLHPPPINLLRLFSGRPWQGPLKSTHFTFLFLFFQQDHLIVDSQFPKL